MCQSCLTYSDNLFGLKDKALYNTGRERKEVFNNASYYYFISVILLITSVTRPITPYLYPGTQGNQLYADSEAQRLPGTGLHQLQVPWTILPSLCTMKINEQYYKYYSHSHFLRIKEHICDLDDFDQMHQLLTSSITSHIISNATTTKATTCTKAYFITLY